MNASTRLLLVLMSMLGLAHVEANETNYFLVGHWLDGELFGDSYVLPLSKPEDIAHARYLISLGPSVWDGPEPPPAIVGAKISYERDGINRDYRDPMFPQWSWHVVEFLRFADISAEILDGSPTSVEDGRYTGGELIGFWRYTVVRELGPVPLYLSIVPDDQHVQVYWSGLGASYVYTLETKRSADSQSWVAVPGAEWPLATNQWTLPMTNAEGFFRVKAEELKE
jgi:hypothetical protein